MADPGLIGFKNNPEGLGERDWDWVSGREEEVEARHKLFHQYSYKSIKERDI